MKQLKRFYNLEIKQLGTEDEKFYTVSGIATTSGTDLDNDIIEAGAFADNVANPSKIRFLYNHDSDLPMGTITSFQQVGNALHMEAKMPKGVQRVEDTVKFISMGAFGGFSVGFRVIEDEFDRETGIRRIIKAKLFEVSIATIPANPEAVITDIKKDDEKKESKLDEDFKKIMTWKDLQEYSKENFKVSNKEFQCIVSKAKQIYGEELKTKDGLLAIKSMLTEFIQRVKG